MNLPGRQSRAAVAPGSGSEANNLAIRGAVLAAGVRRPHVVTQVTEHPAVLATCRALHRLHDVQAAGKIPVDVAALDVDLLTLVGHKMYAPTGIAALWARPGVRLEPVVYGGGQECRLPAGTENVPYVVALGAAAAPWPGQNSLPTGRAGWGRAGGRPPPMSTPPPTCWPQPSAVCGPERAARSGARHRQLSRCRSRDCSAGLAVRANARWSAARASSVWPRSRRSSARVACSRW